MGSGNALLDEPGILPRPSLREMGERHACERRLHRDIPFGPLAGEKAWCISV